MTALSAARNTNMPSGGDPVVKAFSIGLAANKKVYAGGIVVLNPANGGYAEPGSTAVGLIALGRAEPPPFAALPAVTAPGIGATFYDNTGGSNGGITVQYRQGTFTFANSAAADLIAVTNIGADCYIVDDQTVALTDANGTRSRAGKIMGVDASGSVQVQLGVSFAAPTPTSPYGVVSIPIDFATLANAQAYAFTPGFAGRILGIAVIVRKPATTASKAATVQAQVNGGNTTGGAVAMTSANMTPAGATVAGTAITAVNTFTAAQTAGFAISGVTAFIEGDGSVLLSLR